MVIKYIIMLHLITPDLNFSLSIKKDIAFAKQFLKYHEIPEPDLCKKVVASKICSKYNEEVCSARLLKNKMEFKQFENPCYMDINNFCESQDNIWTIKNAGSCVMNAELRRFAKEIEKMVTNDTSSTQTDDNKTSDDDKDDTTTLETADDEVGATETSPDDATETATEADANDETTTDENNTGDENNDTNDETTVTEDTESETTTDENVIDGATKTLTEGEEENSTNDYETNATEETDGITTDATETNSVDETTANNAAIDEIGKIFYDDGSIKALREGADVTARFPPLRAKLSWDKKPCEKRVKPCPNIYFPVCLYFSKEKPNNITYYHFVNSCEAQQYTCYHPERKIDGTSSMRAGFCAHIQYINYARFVHTMSAWGHYGWLHGPWPFNHILKPHERA